MTWWRGGVVYEIYPRSFQDTDGDGVGDLRGIAERLPYLRWLGVDAIWITPFYPSPLRDFGYDITDHTAVAPEFGTLEDFDELVAAAHRERVRVILDYVPNHTSDEHPWFRDPSKRDWYYWRDGDPPNNWISMFGGSAWQYDPAVGKSFYHAYLREQPDLNWRNEAVREAMFDVLRFWIDRGVDGFRVDAARQLAKDPELRDNPPNPDYRPDMPERDRHLPIHSVDLDDVQEPIAAIRREIGDDRLMIAEVYAPIERLVRYYGEDGRGAHLPFNMHLISTPWRAEEIAALVERYEAALPDGAWPNWVLGNHDQPRVASRIGPEQARVAAILLLTLRGTPTLYYGDEIGMLDVPIPPDRVRDPGPGRDPERTPMRWDSGPNAGFCPPGVEPWLPVGEGPDVAAQRDDPRSMLTLHRRLLALRRGFAEADYRTLHVSPAVFAYGRGERIAVALNLTGDPQEIPISGEVILSTHLDGGERNALRAHEGVLLDLESC